MLSYFVLSVALASSQGICPLNFATSPYPLFEYEIVVGYDGTEGYHEDEQISPEPIPLGVTVQDTDTVVVSCGTLCTSVGIDGGATVQWSWDGDAQAKQHGGFISPNGAIVDTVIGFERVLFLPPENVAEGSTAEFKITATVVDLVELAPLYGTGTSAGNTLDPQWAVDFTVVVSRYTDAANTDDAIWWYSVSAGWEPATPLPIIEPPECDPQPAVCEYLAENVVWGNATVGFVSAPSHLLLGEIRPIYAASGQPMATPVECGTPPGHDPVDSNFGFLFGSRQPIITWRKKVVAGQDGDGVFVSQGRAALFAATSPGALTLEIEVAGLYGPVKAETTIVITEPKLRSLSFADGKTLLRDDTGREYRFPSTNNPNERVRHWFDANGDGDAADVGDRRIPVAYASSEHVRLDEILVESSQSSTVWARVRGTDSEGRIFYATLRRDNSYSGTFLVARGAYSASAAGFRKVSSSTALPSSVERISDYHISWELATRYAGGSLVGSTSHRIYVTLGAPIVHPDSAKLGLYESVYDVSCRAASGLTDANIVADAIWTEFTSLIVPRKLKNGFNVHDGLRLYYWQPGLVSLTEQTLKGLMAKANGSCLAWAQFFRACLLAQGTDFGRVAEVTLDPANGNHPYFLVKNWATTGGMGPFALVAWPTGAPNQIYDRPGVLGQGYTTPGAKVFANHFVVIWNDQVYDPSYGIGGDFFPIQVNGGKVNCLEHEFSGLEGKVIEILPPSTIYQFVDLPLVSGAEWVYAELDY